MKKYILLSLILLLSVGTFAQNISVKSFRLLPNDMAASSLEGKKTDRNGDVAALIKVVTNEEGFVFEGGTLGIVDTKQRVSEIWVWVPRGLRKITIMHPQLGQLRDYRFPVDIESERTYEMVLTTAKIETIVKEEIKEQYLVFQVTPHDAVLEVNDQMWTLSANGSVSRLVNFGTYTYRVQASNYYPDVGNVVVNDPDNTKLVTVDLKPNFGWIEVKGNDVLQGAAVYIDNAFLGKAPCKSGALKSGMHSVRISKEMYEAYTTTVTVKDNETTTLSPNLSADFARLTFQVEADAEIWVNNERKGIRTWTGDLATGVYRIECKQTNHEPTSTTKEVTSRMNGEVVQLDAPKPICGTQMVESDPPLASIYIDGKPMGETPKLIKEILIGQHELRLTKDGYADYTETITIVKGERKQVTATLSNGREVQFTCNVPNAILEIDGRRMNSVSGTFMLTYGSHSIRATAAEYQDYSATMNVSENTRTYGITMQTIRRVPEGAVDGVYSVGPGKKVYFSKGNLQYQASTGKWRFAENQYDCIGNANSNISSSYSGWIDLFGWGTSGYNNKYPYMTSTSSTDYGNGNNDIAGTNYDWGVYNKISNGGNTANTWRTLTNDEWVYVFNTRSTSSGIRYAKACVNSQNGVILLPDDWNTSYYSLSSTNNTSASFTSNTISASQWTTLEQRGAVFLPAAGYRYGTSVDYVGSIGSYWSASYNGEDRAYYVDFGPSGLIPEGWGGRYGGRSVRLVRDAQ